MLLLGNFQHTLDDKNRIRLPAKYREKLGNEYIMLPGNNGCISLYPASAEEKFIRVVNELGEFSAENAETLRIITDMAATVEADSQGRFMLPNELIKFAKIDKDVRIIGVIDRVEIWSEEKYVEWRNGSERTADALNALNMKLHNAMHKQQ